MLAALLLSRLSGLPSGLLNELDTAVGTRRTRADTRGETAQENTRRMFKCCSLEGASFYSLFISSLMISTDCITAGVPVLLRGHIL